MYIYIYIYVYTRTHITTYTHVTNISKQTNIIYAHTHIYIYIYIYITHISQAVTFTGCLEQTGPGELEISELPVKAIIRRSFVYPHRCTLPFQHAQHFQRLCKCVVSRQIAAC